MVNGFVLRMVRIKKRLTQREIADKAGLSQPCICRVETGDLPLSDAVRDRIVHVLEFDESDQKLIEVLIEGGE